MILTEKEVILMVIRYGVKGSLGILETYNKLGKLQGKDSINSLIKMAKTIYVYVSIAKDKKGKLTKGKGRKYELLELREEQIELEDKRINNGKKPTNDDELMTEHIYKLLSNKLFQSENGKSLTFNKWISHLSLFNMATDTWKAYSDLLESIYTQYKDDFPYMNMVSMIRSNFEDRLYDVFEGSIKRLEKQGRVKVSKQHIVKYIQGYEGYREFNHEYNENETYDDLFVYISEYQFFLLEQLERREVENLGITWKTYKSVKAGKAKSNDEIKSIIRQVKEFLADQYGIDYYFTTVTLNTTSKEEYEVNYNEFRNIFIKRLIELTEDRMKRDDYANATVYTKKFYRLNMFLFIKQLRIKEIAFDIDKQIQYELSTVSNGIDDIRYEFFMQQERQSNEYRESNTLGKQLDNHNLDNLF